MTTMKVFQLSTLKILKLILVFISAVFHVLEGDQDQFKHLSGSHHITLIASEISSCFVLPLDRCSEGLSGMLGLCWIGIWAHHRADSSLDLN